MGTVTDDKERFLTRWSRRKRGEGSAADKPPKPPEKSATVTASKVPAATPVSEETQPAVDLASLPPLETIGAGSDIRAFLAPGVPPDLVRAALRRAWSTDPKVRDFIGLSENSWDFNAPGGVPGFGPLSTDDIRQLLTQVTGEPTPKDVESAIPGPAAAREPESHEPLAAEGAVPDNAPARPPPTSDGEPSETDGNIAMQQDFESSESCPPLPKRRHGGALPQ